MTPLNQAEIRQARIDLAAAFRWAVRQGLNEGICNHFSMDVGGGRFLVNALGWHWSELSASNLLIADFDGNVLEGEGEVEPTAFYIHSRIHRNCPQATVVLHTHMPYATALTVVEGGRLEPCEQKAIRLCKTIVYDDDYQGLALDNSEGDRMAAKLGDKRILFLASHGVIVTHRTVAESTSGAGGADVGVAGSVAINLARVTSTAEVGGDAALADGGDGGTGVGALKVRAHATTDNTAIAQPAGEGAVAGSVGVGASFALNLMFHDTTADIQDGATISGTAGSVAVEAIGEHRLTTESRNGAKGGTGATRASGMHAPTTW